MDELSFNLKLWATSLPLPPGGCEQLRCPACRAILNVHQPEDDVPNRLMASCTCEECALWLALVVTPDRSRVYMVRIPSPPEMWEALSREERGRLPPP
jgi:hypothetical protein